MVVDANETDAAGENFAPASGQSTANQERELAMRGTQRPWLFPDDRDDGDGDDADEFEPKLS